MKIINTLLSMAFAVLLLSSNVFADQLKFSFIALNGSNPDLGSLNIKPIADGKMHVYYVPKKALENNTEEGVIDQDVEPKLLESDPGVISVQLTDSIMFHVLKGSTGQTIYIALVLMGDLSSDDNSEAGPIVLYPNVDMTVE